MDNINMSSEKSRTANEVMPDGATITEARMADLFSSLSYCLLARSLFYSERGQELKVPLSPREPFLAVILAREKYGCVPIGSDIALALPLFANSLCIDFPGRVVPFGMTGHQHHFQNTNKKRILRGLLQS